VLWSLAWTRGRGGGGDGLERALKAEDEGAGEEDAIGGD
jgi:hypothetical protein